MRCSQKTAKYLLDNSIFIEETGCREWTGTFFNSGYGSACVEYKTYLAHRLAYLTFVGPIGQNKVCHSCDNPKCINPSHLFLGSQQDNMDDKVKKGRQHKPKGILHGMAKLSEETVREIKASNKKNWELAEKYGIDSAQISRIRNNKAWAHIK